MDYAAGQFAQVVQMLPYDLRRWAEALPEQAKARAEEIRLRAGRPLCVSYPTGEVQISGSRTVDARELHTVLEIVSEASAHTVLEQVKHGFVAVRGGHRLGLCGSGVVKDGQVANLRRISSLSIRVAREIRGLGDEVLPKLLINGNVGSTLILSPPGGGKTTLLRDLIRCISDGEGVAAARVGVADERGELAAMHDGVPQLDLGARADVMDGCPKAAALMMLLRGMNPQVMALDEVTDPEDIDALMQAAGCGVTLLATAHGAHLRDLRRRPLYQKLLTLGVFDQVVIIHMEGGVRQYTVTRLDDAL